MFIKLKPELEAGEEVEDEDGIAELIQRIKAADLPPHALKAAQKEVKVCMGSSTGSMYRRLLIFCVL